MPSKKKTSEPSEADIVFTRASVALAKSQRLIASWLPAKSDAELARESGDAGNEDDDLETGNELLGVGAATPPTTDTGKNILKRKDPSLDALRKQLLGRNASKISATTGHRAVPASAHVTGRIPVRPGATGARPNAGQEEESDSEDGRAGLFSAKTKVKKGKKDRKAKEAVLGVGGEDTSVVKDDDEDGDREATAPEKLLSPSSSSNKPSKRKATSYLDEILAEKSAKKKKKKKAKGTNATITTNEEPS